MDVRGAFPALPDVRCVVCVDVGVLGVFPALPDVRCVRDFIVMSF